MLFITLFSAQAQNSLTGPNDQKVFSRKVIPPSPETASLGKYGDVPVGNFTGIANIAVPIYSFVIDGNEFAISLNYHGGGLKVEEVASNVGLGWSLSAGGVVGSTVQGLSDFDAGGFVRPSDHVDPNFNPNFASNNTHYEAAKAYNNGALDGEPDIYFYNFLNYSGKFVHDQNGIPHLIPNNSKLKIGSTINGGFKITDEKGIVYNFDKAESLLNLSDFSQCAGSSNGSLSINQSWYLTSVVYRNGEIVLLDYEYYNYSYINRPSESSFYDFPDNYGCSGITPNPKICASSSYYHTPRIKRITYKNLEIIFGYENQTRLDLYGSNALKTIEVNNGIKTFASWRLEHGYFNTGYFSEVTDTQNQKDLRYKLKLLSVKRLGEQPYSFNYNEDVTLPHRMSSQVDYWGYYNGNGTASTSILPKVVDRVAGTIDGTDREVNPFFAKQGALKKITYPTGGFSEFEFESNDYYKCRDILSSESKSVAVVLDAGELSKSASFTIDTNSRNFLFRYSQGSAVTQFDMMLTVTGPNNYQASFTGQNLNGQVLNQMAPGQYTISMMATAFDPTAFLQFSWDQLKDTLECKNWLAGGIRVKKITDNANNGGNLKVKRFDYGDIETNGRTSGFIVNEPAYLQVQMYPRVVLMGQTYLVDHVNPCRYIVRSASSYAPLGNIQGANVGYRYVTVYEEDGAIDNGRSIFKYAVYNDIGSPVIYPFAPQTSYDWIRGLLLEQRDEKRGNSGYSLIKKLTNTYDIRHNPSQFWDYRTNLNVNETNILGIKVGSFVPEMGTGTTFVLPAQFQFEFFKYVSAWYSLKKTEIKEYFGTDTTNYTLNSVEYFYDNPLHMKVNRVNKRNSAGQTYLKNIFYPGDYVPGTPFIDFLIDKNEIGAEIEELTILDDGNEYKVLNGTIKEYFSSGLGKLKETFTLDLQSPISLSNFKLTTTPQVGSPLYQKDDRYKSDEFISLYDSYGNPLSMRKPNGPPISFLYSYKGKYPIVEVIGVDYTDLLNQLGSSVVADLEQQFPDQVAVESLVPIIRNAFPEAQIRTWSYDSFIGMNSATDEKRLTTYYNYDDLGRLKYIKDKDGNIVKSYEYNFINRDPEWVNLSTRRCVTIGGNYTGEEEQQQQDSNLYSLTYGQIRWVSLGHTGNCISQQIYARIEAANVVYDYPNGMLKQDRTTNADMYLRLYTDAACTIPYITPTDYTVSVNTITSFNFDSGIPAQSYDNTLNYIVPANSSQYYFGNIQVGRIDDTYDFWTGTGDITTVLVKYKTVPLVSAAYISVATTGQPYN